MWVGDSGLISLPRQCGASNRGIRPPRKYARKEEELQHTLQGLVHGNGEKMLADLEPAVQRFLREWVFKADGQASARIAALTHQMANT